MFTQDQLNRVCAAVQVRTAKAKYLKAIDFTLGLIKRLEAQGLKIPGAPAQEVARRLIEMRKATQNGFRLDTLKSNKRLLSGRGEALLSSLEKKEGKLLPSEKDLAAFIKPFPDKKNAAALKQSRILEDTISKKLNVPKASIYDQLMNDRQFMFDAYAAILPEISKTYSKVTSMMKGLEGQFLHRVKAPNSIWGKQHRTDTPMTELADLIGCMSVVPDVATLAEAAAFAQQKFGVIRKRNNYLENKGYNAINYVFETDGILFEYQIKTSINKLEAALSHDLIYAPEKAIAQLSKEEKALVSLVIDVSTQLSMKEWGSVFDIQTRMANLDAAPLPEDPWRYFKKTPGAQLFPMDKLRPIRARPKGIQNARKYMRGAYLGKNDRRVPLDIEDRGDGTFTVLDGNSIFAVAKQSGWRRIPGILVK